jgi:hypothetical protein
MSRGTTIAAGAGVLTGLLGIGDWLYGVTHMTMTWDGIVVALAALLIADSLIAMIGPRKVFYSVALLSALLAASEWAGARSGLSWGGAVTVVLAVATVALGVAVAFREPGVSEESHPMNLPVFG